MLGFGEIIGGAFSVIRQRPGWVLIWSLLYFVAMIGLALVLQQFVGMMPVTTTGNTPPVIPPNFFANLGLLLLAYLGFFLLYMLIYVGALRAVLRPDQPSLAGIRFGADELRIIALTIFMGVIAYIALLIIMVPLAVMGFGFSRTGPTQSGILTFALGMIVMFVLFAFFAIRLSLASALTFLREQFVLAESWRLTRGRFWILFAAYLVLALISFGATFLVAAINAGVAGAGASQMAFSPQSLAASREAASFMLSPVSLVLLAINSVIAMIGLTMWAGAQATVARALVSDTTGIADTFA